MTAMPPALAVLLLGASVGVAGMPLACTRTLSLPLGLAAPRHPAPTMQWGRPSRPPPPPSGPQFRLTELKELLPVLPRSVEELREQVQAAVSAIRPLQARDASGQKRPLGGQKSRRSCRCRWPAGHPHGAAFALPQPGSPAGHTQCYGASRQCSLRELRTTHTSTHQHAHQHTPTHTPARTARSGAYHLRPPHADLLRLRDRGDADHGLRLGGGRRGAGLPRGGGPLPGARAHDSLRRHPWRHQDGIRGEGRGRGPALPGACFLRGGGQSASRPRGG